MSVGMSVEGQEQLLARLAHAHDGIADLTRPTAAPPPPPEAWPITTAPPPPPPDGVPPTASRTRDSSTGAPRS
jgi:hypothetical protein